MSKLNSYFSFDNSRFGVQKSKESTARIALFKYLKTTPCIYTMESSFAGVDQSKDKGKHLTTSMLETLGRDLCRTLLIYCQIYVPPELKTMFKAKKVVKKKTNFLEDQEKNPEPDSDSSEDVASLIMQELSGNKNLIKMGQGNSSAGSDSAPSEDNMNPTELLKNLPVADKALKQKIKSEKDKKNNPKPQKPEPKKTDIPPTKRPASPPKEPKPKIAPV